MVEHEIVIDKENNEYNIKMDSKLLTKLCQENKLFTFDNIQVSYVPSYIRKDNVKVTAFFRTKSEHIIISGERYITNSEGMTKEHRQTQENLKLFLEQFISEQKYKFLEQEIPKTGNIADVYFEYNNVKYVIEVQRSRYSRQKYTERTENYKKSDIKLIWLVILDDDNSFNNRNFYIADEMNGGYLPYLTLNNLNLNNLKKRRGNQIIDFDKENATIEDLIVFLFDKNSGLDSLKDYIDKVNNLKYEFLNCQELLNSEQHTYFKLLDNIENLRININNSQNQIEQYKKDIFNLNKDFFDKKRILTKPLLKLEELENKIKLYSKEKDELWDKTIKLKDEIDSLELSIENRKKIKEEILSEETILELKKLGLIFEPIKGELRIVSTSSDKTN